MVTREELLTEAHSWLRTPYHLGGQVKGAGCDCATFIYCVYHACGLIESQEIGVFAPDFASVLTEEVYMLRLIKIARKTVEGVTYPTLKALPGNILLTKTHEKARINNHGGIVKDWPFIYHCVPDSGVAIVDATKNRLWSFKPVTVFDPWEKTNGIS